jgi:hypothetical protein
MSGVRGHDDAQWAAVTSARTSAGPAVVATPSIYCLMSESTIWKDLVLLHERDPIGTFAAVRWENLRREEITWVGLKEALHLCLPYVQYFQKQLQRAKEEGRLTPEQFRFGDSAAAAIIASSNERSGLPFSGETYSNIYEACWFLNSEQDSFRNTGKRQDALYHSPFKDYLYRGMANAAWSLTPSLIRDETDQSARTDSVTIGTILQRQRITEDFIAALSKSQPSIFPVKPGNEVMLAVAQHFGLPTTYLDFTEDLSVAAFFATASQHDNSRGVLYRLRADYDTSNVSPWEDRSSLNVRKIAQVQLGKPRFVRPDLPHNENRIGAQRGAFVEAANPSHLQMFISRAYFIQRSGLSFSDDRRAVNYKELYRPNSRIEEIARPFVTRFKAGAAGCRVEAEPHMTDDIRLPRTSIFASAARLDLIENSFQGHLDRLNQFLIERDCTEARLTVEPAIEKYFQDALTDPVSEDPFQQYGFAFNDALQQLATWSGVSVDELNKGYDCSRTQIPQYPEGLNVQIAYAVVDMLRCFEGLRCIPDNLSVLHKARLVFLHRAPTRSDHCVCSPVAPHAT